MGLLFILWLSPHCFCLHPPTHLQNNHTVGKEEAQGRRSCANPKSENLPSVCELELITWGTRFISVSSIQYISMRALLITNWCVIACINYVSLVQLQLWGTEWITEKTSSRNYYVLVRCNCKILQRFSEGAQFTCLGLFRHPLKRGDEKRKTIVGLHKLMWLDKQKCKIVKILPQKDLRGHGV